MIKIKGSVGVILSESYMQRRKCRFTAVPLKYLFVHRLKISVCKYIKKHLNSRKTHLHTAYSMNETQLILYLCPF